MSSMLKKASNKNFFAAEIASGKNNNNSNLN